MRDQNDRKRPKTIPEDDLLLFEDEIEDEIEEDDQVGTPRSLMLVDRLIYATHENDRRRPLLFQLRRAIVEDEMTFQEAREAIVEMQETIEKLTSPANRIGTLLGMPKKEVAHVIMVGPNTMRILIRNWMPQHSKSVLASSSMMPMSLSVNWDIIHLDR